MYSKGIDTPIEKITRTFHDLHDEEDEEETPMWAPVSVKNKDLDKNRGKIPTPLGRTRKIHLFSCRKRI